jgi:molybdopterin molybdotransferase
MTDPEQTLSSLLTVEQAIGIIDQIAVVPRVVELALARAAGHRVAAEVVADRDYPPFDKSLMDGYAVACADTAGATKAAPVRLEVIGEIAAGSPASALVSGRLAAGKAVAIMTGAPVPAGADGIVPVEVAQRERDEIAIQSAAIPGRYITRRGGDCAAGQVVLAKGVKLNAAGIAVAAAVGADPIALFDLPRVGVLSTGNELVTAGSPAAHQIRDSNGPMLRVLCERLGCKIDEARHAPDDPAVIAKAIEEGLAQNDVLLIAGGMSAGAHDHVPAVLERIGFTILIRQLRIKPGKPFVFATRAGGEGAKFVFGLPGNPVSAYVCTLRLANRLLRRMAGGGADEAVLNLPLAEAIGPNGPREFYQPGEITPDGRVRPLAWKGSADIFTLARGQALIIREENAAGAEAGSLVRVMMMP